jgi:hypothetical protein
LGLFIQQKVGQASESRQTPDFGSFYLDDRGEMVISLRNQSFDALKARAFSALQRGDFITFKQLVEKIYLIKPNSPESLYLEYRLMLHEGWLRKAAKIVDKLYDLHLQDGIIPLSQNDLLIIRNFLNIPSWKVERILPLDFPLYVKLIVDNNKDDFVLAKEDCLGEEKIYIVKNKSIVKLKITNPTQDYIHVYLIEIDSRGRITSAPLWQDEFVAWNGLAPGQTELSYSFRITGKEENGICEMRLFSSNTRKYHLLIPPPPGSRILQPVGYVDVDGLREMRMKIIRYTIL